MRVAIYHRVSTLDQDPGLAQGELTAWVERQGGTVELEVTETASGSWNGRPGLQRVLKAATRGRVDCVAVWKLDRFGRSSLDVLSNIEALSSAGCRFVAITQGIDAKPGGDAMSRLILGVLAAVAEFERDLIRERTVLGLERARARGVQLGRPRNSAQASDVQELRSQGATWAQVADALGCSVGTARRRAKEQTA
jgi:DNA invertase Pin-like site-specific DNA recombinase